MELALPLPARRSPWHRVAQLLALHRSRRGLARLDPHLLRDIGLTEAQAQAEVARAPWDAPDHWQMR